MKKVLFTIITVLLSITIFQFVQVKAQTYTGDEVVTDLECISFKTFLPSDYIGPYSAYLNCSSSCPRSCIYSSVDYTTRINGYCTKNAGGDYKCETINLPLYTEIYKVNAFGLEIDRALLILIRRALLLVLGASGLIMIGMGIYGTYKYTLSEGNQDKIQEAVKIFKSTIIGAVILFMGVVLIQIASTVTGVTGTLLDFDFMPRTGRVVFTTKDDIGKNCFPEQISDPTSTQPLTCNSTTLVWE